jgi:spermidine dehydrogenase
MNAEDRRLGMASSISRRDFLNGVAVGTGGLLASSWLAGCGFSREVQAAAAQDRPGYNPPSLTGLRGSHPGSFEQAHELRDGSFWSRQQPVQATGESYDVVIVGGGISGLAAAYFYRAQAGPSARILILDNHDDFGGHAKRNEFRPGGRLLLANGGTMSIETPSPYSPEARGLLTTLGIDPQALTAKCVDNTLFAPLKPAVFFDKTMFGTDRLVVRDPEKPWSEFLSRTPLSAEAQRDIARIQEGTVDYLHGLSDAAKKDKLSRISYKNYLLNVVRAHLDVVPFYQSRTHGLYGIGIDAVPALDCWGIGFPGFQGLKLTEGPAQRMSLTAVGEATPNREPYHFHFPDGNASIARLLVRSLVPAAVPGSTAEDIVTAQVDYAKLDRPDVALRIRLNSLVVKARHTGDPSSSSDVEITYARDKRLHSVRAKGCVMACWNMVIPYLCPELPPNQKEALAYGVKVPLVYTEVAIRNWTAFHTLGIRNISVPGGYHTSVGLHQPISIGDYKFPHDPNEPMMLHMLRTPCKPGLSARDQQRFGHMELLTAPFETFERNIRDELGRMLSGGGFDPARDIEGITVNRWPHGYAYEYNPLWDPDWPPGQQPCVIARRRFGRITIANSDAAAYAYTDAAIDQGYRAVQELLTT